MSSATKVQIGVEDLNLETGGASAPSTFARTQSDGAVGGTYTKLSDTAIPVMDPAVVTGAGTPFDEIATASDRDVNECLRQLRINARSAKNFDHYGGQPGSGVSVSVAQKNTEVLKRILDDIASEGRAIGVYFPGTIYEFHENTGLGGNWASHIIAPSGQDGLVFVGGGNSARLVKHSSANTAFNLFHAENCNNVIFQDVHLDANGLNGSLASVQSNGSKVTGVYFDRVKFTDGARAIKLDGVFSGTVYDLGSAWVRGCEFTGQSLNIEAISVTDVFIRDNVFKGVVGGLSLTATTSTSALRDLDIVNNKFLQSSTASIVIQRTNTYVQASHRAILLRDNKLTVGSITVNGLDEVTVDHNTVRDGSVFVHFNTMTTSEASYITRNRVLSTPTDAGLKINATSTLVEELHVLNNIVRDADFEGIVVTATGNEIRGMLMGFNSIKDCGLATTNTWDGIFLSAGDASGGITESIIAHNRVRSTNASFKHRYGIHEETGGVSDDNVFNGNTVKGWGTADILVTGGNSEENHSKDLLTGV